MRSLFDEGAPRYALLFSKGLNAPWNTNTELILPEETPIVSTPQPKSYPNPAFGEMTLNFVNDASWIGKEIRLLNMSGIVIQTIRINTNIQTVSLLGLKPGIYFMQGSNDTKKINQKFVKL
jgi:hypothetical protein